MKKHKRILHLLSGGLDSVTLLYDLHAEGHKLHCLLFDYKQRHVQELLFAKQHCHRLGLMFTTVELPALGGLTEQNWIVPNRNAVMLSVAVNKAVLLKSDWVTIACNADDASYFPDCRAEFIQSMNMAVKAAGFKVQIYAPYLDWPKWKIAGLAQEMGVPINEIWTCYRGGAKPCGKCLACRKLADALK